MGRKKIVKASSKRNLILGFIALVIVGVVGTYYLMTQTNLGSQGASAGVSKKVTLEGFTMTLEKVTPSNAVLNKFKRENKGVSAPGYWKYVVTGQIAPCYTTNVGVSSQYAGFESGLKGADLEELAVADEATKSRSIINLRIVPKSSCGVSAQKMNKVSHTGMFFADYESSFNFAVIYLGAGKTVSNQVTLTNREVKVVSNQVEDSSGVGSWAYNVTGNISTCYNPTLLPISSSKSGLGRYVLRLSEKSSKISGCEKSSEKLKLNGSVKSSEFKHKTARLDIRFVTSDTFPKLPVVEKVIKSEGFTFTYSYLGKNEWKYTIKGNLPSTCRIAKPSHTVTKSLPEKVNVVLKLTTAKTEVCTQVVVPYTYTGKISASEKAILNFTVDEGNKGAK